jgi:hypothetical protein
MYYRLIGSGLDAPHSSAHFGFVGMFVIFRVWCLVLYTHDLGTVISYGAQWIGGFVFLALV